MGVDCGIIINGELHSLDRWYVFMDFFESGKTYKKDEFLEKIIAARDRKVLEENYGPRWVYHDYWLGQAGMIVGQSDAEEFVICDDMSAEYENCLMDRWYKSLETLSETKK